MLFTVIGEDDDGDDSRIEDSDGEDEPEMDASIAAVAASPNHQHQ